jgi:hypothetical protein
MPEVTPLERALITEAAVLADLNYHLARLERILEQNFDIPPERPPLTLVEDGGDDA